MTVDIVEIKAANSIEEVIAETIELQQSGANQFRGARSGVGERSLVVFVDTQSYAWYRKPEFGDVITWVERYRKMDFKEAVEWLCRRARLEPPTWGQDSAKLLLTRQKYDTLTVAAEFWHESLLVNEDALNYCYSRGWTDETIQAARLGYCDGDVDGLKDRLWKDSGNPGDNAGRAVLDPRFKGMLIYPVWRGGRVVYFAGRATAADVPKEKAHHNPPVKWVGERIPYYNHAYGPLAEFVVLVEGQADAVTLTQWNIPAIALAGVSANKKLIDTLKRNKKHKTWIVGLDADQIVTVAKLADALGPMTRIVDWPADDPNAWLQDGGTADEAEKLIARSDTWIMRQARNAGQSDPLFKEAMVKEVMVLATKMPEFSVANIRKELCKELGIAVREFNSLLKAAKEELTLAEEEDEETVPSKIITTPGTLIGESLVEMIAIPPKNEYMGFGLSGWRTQFVVKNGDTALKTVDHIDQDGIRYIPIDPRDPILIKRIVQFPSALGDKHSIPELIQLIRDTIRKYVDVPHFYERLSAYYILLTWLYDAFSVVPYLRMLGEYGTGKSRFLQVVGAMCYRPFQVTATSTISPVFRTMDVFRGTLVADEMDVKWSDTTNDWVKIFNTGNDRWQGVVLRTGDKSEGFPVKAFSTFGPKLIATRQEFEDKAFESRCITNKTGGPTLREDIPEDLPQRFWSTEATAMRNALLRYRMDNWKPNIEIDRSLIQAQGLEPRLRQMMGALATIIGDDEGLRAEFTEFVRDYQRQLIAERGMTIPSKVLEALIVLWTLETGWQVRETDQLIIKRVAMVANILMDYENAQETSGDDGGGQGDKQLKPKTTGNVVRKDLQLKTARSKASHRAYQVVWDETRVMALRRRYGLEDEEWIDYIIPVVTDRLDVKGIYGFDPNSGPEQVTIPLD